MTVGVPKGTVSSDDMRRVRLRLWARRSASPAGIPSALTISP